MLNAIPRVPTRTRVDTYYCIPIFPLSIHSCDALNTLIHVYSRPEFDVFMAQAARGKLDAAFVQAVGKYRQTSNFCVTPLAAAGQEEPAHAVASGVWEELRGLAQRFLTRPEVDAGKPLCHTVPIEELMHYYWLVVFTYDAASALGVAEGDSGKMQLVPQMVEFLSSFDSTSIAALAEVRRDAADDLITRKASMQLENGRLKLRLIADAAAARGTRSETAEETARRTEIVAEAEASFRAALETSKGLASTPAQEGASMETLYHLSGLLEARGSTRTGSISDFAAVQEAYDCMRRSAAATRAMLAGAAGGTNRESLMQLEARCAMLAHKLADVQNAAAHARKSLQLREQLQLDPQVWPEVGRLQAIVALALPKGEDSHESCRQWSVMGECTANPSFMLEQCKTSCAFWDSVRAESGGSAGPETAPAAATSVSAGRADESTATRPRWVLEPEGMASAATIAALATLLLLVARARYPRSAAASEGRLTRKRKSGKQR